MNPVPHAPWYWQHLVAFIAGGGLANVAARISVALPPLPEKAGFWQQFGYNMLKGLGGVDPNKVTKAS